MFLAGVVVGSLVTLVMVSLYSCLVVAGRADRQMEQMIKQDERFKDK